MFSPYNQYIKNVMCGKKNANCNQEAVEEKDDWAKCFHCCRNACGYPICFWGPPSCLTDCCCDPCCFPMCCCGFPAQPCKPGCCCKCADGPPCLVVCDTTTQTVCSKKPKLITFDTNKIARTIRHNAFSGRITVPVCGIYSITFTASIGQAKNVFNNLDIWVRQNGVDADLSNRKTAILSADSIHTMTATYVLQLFTDDYLEFFQSAEITDAGAGLYAQHHNGEPSTPSAMAAVNLISF